MKRESRPHGEPEFAYHPHRVEDPASFADNYDRIFRHGKYAHLRTPEGGRKESHEQDTENHEHAGQG